MMDYEIIRHKDSVETFFLAEKLVPSSYLEVTAVTLSTKDIEGADYVSIIWTLGDDSIIQLFTTERSTKEEITLENRINPQKVKIKPTTLGKLFCYYPVIKTYTYKDKLILASVLSKAKIHLFFQERTSFWKRLLSYVFPQ